MITRAGLATGGLTFAAAALIVGVAFTLGNALDGLDGTHDGFCRDMYGDGSSYPRNAAGERIKVEADGAARRLHGAELEHLEGCGFIFEGRGPGG